MKLLNRAFLTLGLLVFSATSHAALSSQSNGIAKLVEQLGAAINNKAVVYQLQKGTTARALIEEKYLTENKQTELGEDFEYEDNVKSIEESDGTTVGTATFGAATVFVKNMAAEYSYDANGDQMSKDAVVAMNAKVQVIMTNLAKVGAIFGFDSNGSGVCGVNFTTLFVIDIQNKVIYEIVFVSGPC